MRFHDTTRDQKRRIDWTTLLAYVAFSYAAVIAGAELFWYLFTGGWSLLIGGYALVGATLLVIRTVGARLAMPAQLYESRVDAP